MALGIRGLPHHHGSGPEHLARQRRREAHISGQRHGRRLPTPLLRPRRFASCGPVSVRTREVSPCANPCYC